MLFIFAAMSAKKKISVWVMSIILLCPLFAFVVLCTQKKIVQYKMEERLEVVALKKIVLKKGTFSWVKSNNEIKVNGKMFDVKYYSIKDDEISFVGLFDEDEEKLTIEIEELLSDKKHSSIPLQKVLKFLLTPSAVAENDYSSAIANIIIKKEFYNYIIKK